MRPPRCYYGLYNNRWYLVYVASNGIRHTSKQYGDPQHLSSLRNKRGKVYVTYSSATGRVRPTVAAVEEQ
jgi:hypothetical protein